MSYLKEMQILKEQLGTYIKIEKETVLGVLGDTFFHREWWIDGIAWTRKQ